MKVIDLLNKIANNDLDTPDYIEFFDRETSKANKMMVCEKNIIYYMDRDALFLNDEVEIIEEEKELHANDIEFNINNDKKDCIITLDENDLGIDKLHLDNCYFYKENDKWYVKKINLNPIAYASQEHKIPEKLKIEQDTPNSNFYIRNEYGTKCALTKHSKIIVDKINEILDYLEEIE